MKLPIIDAIGCISIKGNAGSTPELLAISGNDPTDRGEALEKLDSLLDALGLDAKTDGQIRDLAAFAASEGEARGFRRGFRMGARLMMECLGGPEKGDET